MIDNERYALIQKKHGAWASWAIWRKEGRKSKEGIGDLAIFQEEQVTELLKPQVIMVGLNLSRFTVSEPFRNFHDPSPRAQDYKIRYAFNGTEFSGAYMTDIIKGVVEVDSKNIPKHLKQNPDVLRDSLKTFREEVGDLGVEAPLILGFGGLAFEILKEHLLPNEYRKLVRLTHYSHQIGKEKYREKVLAEIQASGI
jgi:hypothetical protein